MINTIYNYSIIYIIVIIIRSPNKTEILARQAKRYIHLEIV